MSVKNGIKWVGAFGLLIGGGALLVADSAAPLSTCDDVESLEKSYAVEFSCELSEGEVTERSGTLELEYVRVQRFERGDQYERNDDLRYVDFEDWIIGLSEREELELDGEELRLSSVGFYPNGSECTSDDGGTATIDLFSIEFEFRREGVDEEELEFFYCNVDTSDSALVECERYDYSTSHDEEVGADLSDCTLTLQEI